MTETPTINDCFLHGRYEGDRCPHPDHQRAAAAEEPQLTLCGHVATDDRVQRHGFEPCPKEKGHDGEHVYWSQTKPHAKRGRNGVWIIDGTGKSLMHATFDGAATSEDICALLALQDVAARHVGRKA